MKYFNLMLKELIIISLILVFQKSFGQYNPIDILTYNIKFKLNSTSNKVLFNIKLEAINFSTKNEFILLTNNSPQFDDISIIEDNNKINIDYESYKKDTLLIKLPKTINKCDTFELNFNYFLLLDSLKKGTKLFMRWYPYQMDDIVTWKVEAFIPNKYHILLPGKLEELKDTLNSKIYFYKQVVPILRYPLVIYKHDTYTKNSCNINGIDIYYYYLTKDTLIQNKINYQVEQSFKFYNTLIGSYAYNNLNLIEIPGIRYINSQPSFVLIGSLFFKYFNYLNWNDWPEHEIAHQWIGSGFFVKSDDPGGSCVFEPLTEYLKFMYYENNFGKDTFDIKLQNIYEEYKDSICCTEKDKAIIDANATRIVYIKGPYVMNLIREKIGDDKWKHFLQSIYSSYKGKFFTYSDFIKNLNQYDNNGDLIILVKKWMEEKGIPQ